MADCRRSQESTLVSKMRHHEQQRQRGGSTRTSSVRRDKDEDLSLFQEMRKLRDPATHILHLEPEGAATNLGALLLSDPVAVAPIQRKAVQPGAAADLLNCDAEGKNDYDWLLTPPDTPLFPSRDLDSQAAYSSSLGQQQAHLLRNSLLPAAIKTCQMASNSHHADTPSPLKLVWSSNPSPTQRSSTPLNGCSNSAQPRGVTPTSSRRANSVRPSTPTRSSTSASKLTQQQPSSTPTRQSSSITSTDTRPSSTTAHSNRPSTPTNQPSTPTRQSSIMSTGRLSNWPSTLTNQSSTPTRQSSSSSITSTGRSFPANSNWPSSSGNIQPSTPPAPPAGRLSTPTLRCSSSSSSSTKPVSTAMTCRNPSPIRSKVASSGVARGISPMRSQYQGSSPTSVRSAPVSSTSWASSPQAHPVITPDGFLSSDIPQIVQTRSEHPSPAHCRQTVHSTGTSQMPDGLRHPSHWPSSLNLARSDSSTSHRQDHIRAHSGWVSLDDDSSYEVSSHSALSSKGLTLERGVRYGQQQSSAQNEDWQSPSHRISPQIVSSSSRKTPGSASHSSENQRSSSSKGFQQPMATKNSIPTYYHTQVTSGLLSRPLTPKSTASSEQGASGALDSSDGDEDLLNGWRQLELSLRGHEDILVLDKQDEKSTSWDSSQHEQNLKLLELSIHSEKGMRGSSVHKCESCGSKVSLRMGKQMQGVVGSHHIGAPSGIPHALELFNQHGVHELANGCQSENSVNQAFTRDLTRSSGEIQRELSGQQEKEESQDRMYQEDKSVEISCFPKPPSGAISRNVDSKADNLSYPFLNQECGPNIESTFGKSPQMKDEILQGVNTRTVCEDVFKRDDGDSSTPSEELEHRSDGGETLVWPLIAKASEELGKSSKSRVIREAGESQPSLHSRWGKIESHEYFQDLKQTGPDPRAAPTPQIVHADQVSAEITSEEDAEHEVQNTLEHGTIACVEQHFVDILEDGGCAHLSHPRSSESSGSFQASHLDVPWSISTISSCPSNSNSSWEDPQYSLNSGVRDLKSSPTNAHVSDVSDLPSLPMDLHKQGASIKQGADVINSSPVFDQHAFVKHGNVRAGQPEGHSLIKQNSSDESCLVYFFDSLESKLSSGLQMVKNLKVPEDPETKKAEIMTMNDFKTNTARKSSKTLTSKETTVEGSRLGRQKAETPNLVDSVQLPKVKVTVLPNVELSPVTEELSPVTEEIIENSELLRPNAKKHLSSFKFESKKASTLEADRKDIINRDPEIFLNDRSKQAPLQGKMISKSQTPGAKAMGSPTGPRLSKVNSARAGSPMMAVQSGDSQPTELSKQHTMTEELNGHSRFLNITRRLAAAAAAARAQTQRRWFPGT